MQCLSLIIQIFIPIGVVCNNITVPEDSVISNCTSGLLGFGREGDQCIIRHYNYSELRTCQQGRNWTSTTSKHIHGVYSETSLIGPLTIMDKNIWLPD